MPLQKDLISARYKNDNKPREFLTEDQRKSLELFLNDQRINYMTIIDCPLCTDKSASLIAEKERYGIPLDTVVCDNCGLIRSYRQMDKASANLFYSQYYRNIYDPPVKSDIIAQRYEHSKKTRIPGYVTPDKVVLEIGCGGGWNLMPFQLNNYTYYGFDFDQEFIECGKKQGLNLYLGGLEEIQQKGIKTDYIIISNVLEHVTQPIDFLKKLKPILNDKALIDIYVPSADLLLWGYSGGDLLGTLQNAHNFLFDEITLQTTGRLAGFRIINCLGHYLILEYDKDYHPSLNLAKLNRGKKVVRYLKLVEKLLPLRKKIPFKNKLKKCYCLLKPRASYKKFMIDFWGKI